MTPTRAQRMPNGFLIVGSNDVGLAEVDLLKEAGHEAATGELGYSGGAIKTLYDERFDVRVVKLDDVVNEVKARTLSGGARLDGVALMTCRPYGDGSEIRGPLEEIRGLADLYESFPSVPARVAPIVLSDIKQALTGRAGAPISARWAASVEAARNDSAADVAQRLKSLGARTHDTL